MSMRAAWWTAMCSSASVRITTCGRARGEQRRRLRVRRDKHAATGVSVPVRDGKGSEVQRNRLCRADAAAKQLTRASQPPWIRKTHWPPANRHTETQAHTCAAALPPCTSWKRCTAAAIVFASSSFASARTAGAGCDSTSSRYPDRRAGGRWGGDFLGGEVSKRLVL